MIDLGQEFVYVRNEAELPDDTHLVSRKTDLVLPSGPFRVALDYRGHKHALFPLESGQVEVADATAAVRLQTRELEVDGGLTRFADLECTDSQLELVFEHLVADVVERVVSDPTSPGRSCLEAMHEWRDLMRTAGDAVSREVALGLAGELEALRLLGVQDPAAALGSWTGPERSTHDFSASGRRLEVKTTSSVDGQFVRVSNLDQLDPSTAAGGLHLLVVHCAPDDSAPSLDDRIRALVYAGFSRTALIKAVAKWGYVFESGQRAQRFIVRSLRLWSVDDHFPGLRASDIPTGRRAAISRVTYELSLAAAPNPMEVTEMEEVLATWCHS
ncbi:hypothetical protein GCM10009817_20820 [Terrabacter lapilli]|uniref:PD-(D/E)XK family protein DUF4420 n=1 Tax=Terrabacter lapilli TaxID=436231 RepID=A0ABN2S4M9_9MICO